MPGESQSGDLHLIAPHADGVLVAAIDGLGHGIEAADAARIARATLERDPGADLADLFVSAHSALARSRGVAMSLAALAPGGRLTWLGVGNVEGTLVRADERPVRRADSILMLGGVVGFHLPRLRPSTTAVERGDLLILATDGIGPGYVPELEPAAPLEALANRILGGYGKGADDALVVVARYLG